MNRDEFLNSAIIDAQLTIRALDVKFGFLVLLLSAPLGKVQQILNSVWISWELGQPYLFGLQTTCIVFWLACMSITLFGVAASKPSRAISSHRKTKYFMAPPSREEEYRNYYKKILQEISSKSWRPTEDLVSELLALSSIRSRKSKILNIALSLGAIVIALITINFALYYSGVHFA